MLESVIFTDIEAMKLVAKDNLRYSFGYRWELQALIDVPQISQNDLATD